jgi:uncharacterized protein (TIGR00251 family)
MLSQHSGFRWQKDILVLDIYVQPNARREGYDGLHDNRIKLRIGAPASEGKANQRLVNLLAKTFQVPKRSVELLQGEKTRIKQVAIKQPVKLPDWINEPVS